MIATARASNGLGLFDALLRRIEKPERQEVVAGQQIVGSVSLLADRQRPLVKDLGLGVAILAPAALAIQRNASATPSPSAPWAASRIASMRLNRGSASAGRSSLISTMPSR